MPLWGAVEAGGTKFVCAVGDGPHSWQEEIRYPTTSPEETLGRAVDFFLRHHRQTPLRAVGVGAFGPLDPAPGSSTFGYITTTPKPGWQQTDVVGTLGRALDLPVGFDTDVNAAALGEHRWGAAQGLNTFIYLTVGTGIGGGGMAGGQLLHGLIHPEMGHVRVPHDLEQDPYPGCCPYHGDCLEGLAAGPALEQRWGARPETLGPDHAAWPLEAKYLALGIANYVYTLSPQCVIMGGGVMKQAHLLQRVRRELQHVFNGYLQSPEILQHIQRFVVPPQLGGKAGISGALALAMAAAD